MQVPWTHVRRRGRRSEMRREESWHVGGRGSKGVGVRVEWIGGEWSVGEWIGVERRGAE